MSQPTPPGYPLGYTLQHHIYLCAGCGRKEAFEVMLTCRRTGASARAYAQTGARETIYDLPVQQTKTQWVTPRCSLCIDVAPKEPVPVIQRGLVGKRTSNFEKDDSVSLRELEEMGLL